MFTECTVNYFSHKCCVALQISQRKNCVTDWK